jgi:hypothetical protein
VDSKALLRDIERTRISAEVAIARFHDSAAAAVGPPLPDHLRVWAYA